jgi:hypothetical protein
VALVAIWWQEQVAMPHVLHYNNNDIFENIDIILMKLTKLDQFIIGKGMTVSEF